LVRIESVRHSVVWFRCGARGRIRSNEELPELPAVRAGGPSRDHGEA